MWGFKTVSLQVIWIVLKKKKSKTHTYKKYKTYSVLVLCYSNNLLLSNRISVLEANSSKVNYLLQHSRQGKFTSTRELCFLQL